MHSTESREGPTPNGGVRSTIVYLDIDNQPADKADAVACVIIEYDDNDDELMRTYGIISPSQFARRKPAKGQQSLQWDESEHPRDDGGQFAEKGSGPTTATAEPDEPFSLSTKPDKSTPKPAEPHKDTAEQDHLFAGSDWKPGQEALFDLDAKAEKPKQPATYRWLGKQIFDVIGGGNWNQEPRKHWEEKARKIAAAPRTIEGIHAAYVNAPWMAKEPISKRQKVQYQAILDAMADKDFMDNLK